MKKKENDKVVLKPAIDIDKIDLFQVRDLSVNYTAPEEILFPSSDFVKDPDFELEVIKMVNPKLKSIRILFIVNIASKPTKKDPEKFKFDYRTDYLFEVEDIKKYLKSDKKKKFSVDDELDDFITKIAFSTLRGVLLQKLKGTVFSDFILPVIDLK